MSRESQVLEILREGGTWCDDCLSVRTEITPRQSINQLCNSLGLRGVLIRTKGLCRKCGKLKLSSSLTAVSARTENPIVEQRIETGRVPTKSLKPVTLTKPAGAIEELISRFIDRLLERDVEVYNEFSLQHELGIFLREALPGYLVQFERNVAHFFSSGYSFTKKEIDISVFERSRNDLKYVFELKFPRNGQHPESIFSFCKDVAFIEELRHHGFLGGAAIVFADDRLFYSGSSDGIYKFFRAGQDLQGIIRKPTARRDEEVTIYGRYQVKWKPIRGNLKYACVEI